MNIKSGDEVITTPRSYPSASCILKVGAKPIFADVRYFDTKYLSFRHVKKNYKKNKSYYLCSFRGIPCDMKSIKKIAIKKKIKLIEDCSQAHGAKYSNKM